MLYLRQAAIPIYVRCFINVSYNNNNRVRNDPIQMDYILNY